MTKFYQVWLSADKEAVAREILNTLTHKKMIVGGTILRGPAHFWWKGKEIDIDYFYVMGFTTGTKKAALEQEYEKVNDEKVPMATFIKMEGNSKFLSYIEKNVFG